MPRMTSWMIVLGILYILSLLVGCSPKGRELSDEQWLGLQAKMQQERVEVGRQRDLLEADRRKWEARERSEPVVAAAISACGLLVCSVLPLLLVMVLLWPRQPEPTVDIINQLLIEEITGKTTAGVDEIKRLDQPPHHARLATRQS